MLYSGVGRVRGPWLPGTGCLHPGTAPRCAGMASPRLLPDTSLGPPGWCLPHSPWGAGGWGRQRSCKLDPRWPPALGQQLLPCKPSAGHPSLLFQHPCPSVALASKGAVPAPGWGQQVMPELPFTSQAGSSPSPHPPRAGAVWHLALSACHRGLGSSLSPPEPPLGAAPCPLAPGWQAAGGRAGELQPSLARGHGRSGCRGPAGSTAATSASSGRAASRGGGRLRLVLFTWD